MGKAISLHLLVVRGLEIVIVILTVQTVQLNSSVIMSWAKQSADVGLAGLREWEVARGVMGEEVEVPDVPKEKFIKIVSNSVTVHLNNLNHVGDVTDMYLYVYVHFNFRSLKKMTGIGLRPCRIPSNTKRPTNPSLL